MNMIEYRIMIELIFLRILMLVVRQVHLKSIFCHYWYFLDRGFKFQPSVYNGLHDALVMFINLNDIAIFNICSVNYQCIIARINNDETIYLLRNGNLSNKSGPL